MQVEEEAEAAALEEEEAGERAEMDEKLEEAARAETGERLEEAGERAETD
jgi:hypothetical protein